MSAGKVRWGGIAVFIGIALAVIFPMVLASVVGVEGMRAGKGGVGAATGVVGITNLAVNVILNAIIIFVFFATKNYFNALSYRRADILIYIFISVQVVWVLLGLIWNHTAGIGNVEQIGDLLALGMVGIVVVVITVASFIALLLLAISCLRFGNIGGGIWKAVGILYLVGLIGFFVSVIIVTASVGFAPSAGGSPLEDNIVGLLFTGIGLLCYGAAIICHGIGLILGAGRMARVPSPAEVF